MCDNSDIDKDICLQIYFKRGLFQILASEEEKDSFLLTLFCFQSCRNWMQNWYRLSGVCCFAAKVNSAS